MYVKGRSGRPEVCPQSTAYFLTAVSLNFLCLNGFSKAHFADLSVNRVLRMDWGQGWGWSYSIFRIRIVRSSASLHKCPHSLQFNDRGLQIPGCQLAMTLRNKWTSTAVPATLPPFWCLWPGPVNFTQIDCGGRRWKQDMSSVPPSPFPMPAMSLCRQCVQPPESLLWTRLCYETVMGPEWAPLGLIQVWLHWIPV